MKYNSCIRRIPSHRLRNAFAVRFKYT